jgi:hypothetical protein
MSSSSDSKMVDPVRLLEAVTKRPDMYITPVCFATVVAFIDGLDAGSGSKLLAGIREWLQVKLGKRSSFAWSYLILEREDLLGKDLDMSNTALQARLVELVFADIAEFRRVKEKNEELTEVLKAYSTLGTRRRRKSS